MAHILGISEGTIYGQGELLKKKKKKLKSINRANELERVEWEDRMLLKEQDPHKLAHPIPGSLSVDASAPGCCESVC